MRSRALPVTGAAILQVILNVVVNFPGPWWYMVPGAEETPAFVIYVGIVLGVLGLVAAVGLWMLRTWGFWLTVILGVLNILLSILGLPMVPTGALQAALAVQAVGFVLVLVLVVLPSSRGAFATAQQPSRVR
jgi:membrane-bound ClpP family serine protease